MTKANEDKAKEIERYYLNENGYLEPSEDGYFVYYSDHKIQSEAKDKEIEELKNSNKEYVDLAQKVAHRCGLLAGDNVFDSVKKIESLKAENERLKEENKLYKGESKAHFDCVMLNSELQSENTKLKKLVGVYKEALLEIKPFVDGHLYPLQRKVCETALAKGEQIKENDYESKDN